MIVLNMWRFRQILLNLFVVVYCVVGGGDSVTLFLSLLGWEPRSAPPAIKWLFGVLLIWVWQSGVIKNG